MSTYTFYLFGQSHQLPSPALSLGHNTPPPPNLDEVVGSTQLLVLPDTALSSLLNAPAVDVSSKASTPARNAHSHAMDFNYASASSLALATLELTLLHHSLPAAQYAHTCTCATHPRHLSPATAAAAF